MAIGRWDRWRPRSAGPPPSPPPPPGVQCIIHWVPDGSIPERSRPFSLSSAVKTQGGPSIRRRRRCVRRSISPPPPCPLHYLCIGLRFFRLLLLGPLRDRREKSQNTNGRPWQPPAVHARQPVRNRLLLNYFECAQDPAADNDDDDEKRKTKSRGRKKKKAIPLGLFIYYYFINCLFFVYFFRLKEAQGSSTASSAATCVVVVVVAVVGAGRGGTKSCGRIFISARRSE